MSTEASYGIGFFLAGNYHILCREGRKYRFHVLKPHTDLEPAEMDFYDARKFIEAHPICTNISKHDIRIMPFSEIQDVLYDRSSASTLKLLHINEEEEEEPLH